jgi:hypothetical protein
MIWAALALIGILFVSRKKEVRPVRPRRRGDLNMDDERETLMTSNKDFVDSEFVNNNVVQQELPPVVINTNPEKTFNEAMKDRRTWLVGFIVGISLVQGTFISYSFKNYGLKYIPNDAFITTVGTIGAVMNGLSRSFWGNLMDRLPYKYIFMVLLAVQITIGFTIDSIVSYKVLYLIWIALSYFCLGGHFSMTPTICAKMYGAKTGGQVYSIVFLFFIPAGII